MLYILGNYFNQLEFLKSIYLRVFLSFIISFLIVLIAGKPYINYLKKKKYGESIREDGPATHLSKKGTPTMGGVLLVLAILLSSILVADMNNRLILLIMVCTVLFAIIGFIDDYKKFKVSKNGLSGKKKLLGQACIGILVWFFVYKFGLTGDEILDLSIVNPIKAGSSLYIGVIGSAIFMAIVVMGTSNAVNITDGLDGLVIMPIVISSAIMAVLAYFTGHIELSSYLKLYYIVGSGEITVYLAAICGSGLGFLWYNFYPAQIFMGDTGSLTLGGILGVIAILLKQELLLPIIGGVFVMEALSVIMQVASYKIRKKRIFKMAPLHHHFELLGLAETKVTMRFWIVTLMLGILALGIVRARGLL